MPQNGHEGNLSLGFIRQDVARRLLITSSSSCRLVVVVYALHYGDVWLVKQVQEALELLLSFVQRYFGVSFTSLLLLLLPLSSDIDCAVEALICIFLCTTYTLVSVCCTTESFVMNFQRSHVSLSTLVISAESYCWGGIKMCVWLHIIRLFVGWLKKASQLQQYKLQHKWREEKWSR